MFQISSLTFKIKSNSLTSVQILLVILYQIYYIEFCYLWIVVCLTSYLTKVQGYLEFLILMILGVGFVHIPGILELYSVVGLVGGNALDDMAISLDLVLLYLVLIKEPF